MYYDIHVEQLPRITEIYCVRRRTVWQIVDPDALLIFIAEGRCRITLDGTDYLLSAGQAIFIPEHHPYLRRPVENEMCTLYYAHIAFGSPSEPLTRTEAGARLAGRRRQQTEAFMQNRTPPIPACLIAVVNELSGHAGEVIGLYEEAMAAKLRNQPESTILESVAVIRLLLLCAKAAGPAIESGEAGREASSAAIDSVQIPPDANGKLKKVIAYIRLHAKEAVTVSDLCSLCNFSRQHLTRIFRAQFGKTPIAYINEYRISCAKELFYSNPHLSVKEVAAEMGFSDQHYFTRLFTKITGAPPSRFREHLLTFDPGRQ